MARGPVWLPEHDDVLKRLWSEGVPVRDMARELARTEAAVRRRRFDLGLLGRREAPATGFVRPQGRVSAVTRLKPGDREVYERLRAEGHEPLEALAWLGVTHG